MGVTSYICMQCERKKTVEDVGEKHPLFDCEHCGDEVHFVDPLNQKNPDPELAEQYGYEYDPSHVI